MTRALVLVFLLMAAAVGARAQTAREPYEIMRLLTAAQDRLQNRPGAVERPLQEEQQYLASQFTAAAAGDPKIWESPRNRRALALFLLSGGEAEGLRGIVSRMVLQGDEKKLIDGALAFAEGREKEALAALGGLEPRDLPLEIGGQVALTQGVLNLGVDRARAMQAFDLARLLSPGALVEEAALRRQVFLASDDNDVARFIALSERYRTRFRHSAYAGNFETRFREGFLRFWLEKDEGARGLLEGALVELPPADGRALLFDCARTGLVRGLLPPARRAAQRVKTQPDMDEAMRARAGLYEMAASIFEATPNGAALAAIDATRLSMEDKILRESVMLAVSGLAARESAPAQTGEPTPLMKRAADVLAQRDAMERKP